jgi:ankyrin repeat protein
MVTASEDDKETSEWFPYQKNFRYDFDLTPILTAVLREYDDSDTDRPDLTTLLDVSKTLDATGLDEDWWAWKRNFRDRSPLFQELITFFQHTGTGAAMETSRLQQLLEQPDCLQKWTPLLWAAFIGRLTDFIQLVELGADLFAITPSGRNVASHATECCSHEILSWLCEHKYHERGLDLSLPDLWGETPLHIAAAKSLPCTKVLLENGASVESRQVEGMTPLHYVRYLKGGERFNVVRTLLDHGSDPNAREEGGRTPMFYCLDTVDSVELLLNRGADIFIRDIEGQSILHYACIQDYPLLLSALLSRCPRALMTATDNKGDSPLLTCFQDKHSRVNCARILLERCPITWAIDRNGLTLLHHAVRMGDPMVLRFVLLMPGVDLHAKTPQGQTAEDISKEKGTWGGEIGEMLSAATEKHWQSS